MKESKTPEQVMIDFEHDYGELAGVEFLRACVRFFDNRNEWSNQAKSPMQLLDEAYRYYGTDDEEERDEMLNEAEP